MKINIKGKETEVRIEVDNNYVIFENEFERVTIINGIDKLINKFILFNVEYITNYFDNHSDVVLLEQVNNLFEEYISFHTSRIFVECKDLKGGNLEDYIQYNSYVYNITINYNKVSIDI